MCLRPFDDKRFLGADDNRELLDGNEAERVHTSCREAAPALRSLETELEPLARARNRVHRCRFVEGNSVEHEAVDPLKEKGALVREDQSLALPDLHVEAQDEGLSPFERRRRGVRFLKHSGMLWFEANNQRARARDLGGSSCLAPDIRRSSP